MAGAPAGGGAGGATLLDWFVNIHINTQARQLGNLLEHWNTITRTMTLAATSITQFSETVRELNAEFVSGQLSARDFFSEMGRGIPVLGQLVKMWDSLTRGSVELWFGDDLNKELDKLVDYKGRVGTFSELRMHSGNSVPPDTLDKKYFGDPNGYGYYSQTFHPSSAIMQDLWNKREIQKRKEQEAQKKARDDALEEVQDMRLKYPYGLSPAERARQKVELDFKKFWRSHSDKLGPGEAGADLVKDEMDKVKAMALQKVEEDELERIAEEREKHERAIQHEIDKQLTLMEQQDRVAKRVLDTEERLNEVLRRRGLMMRGMGIGLTRSISDMNLEYLMLTSTDPKEARMLDLTGDIAGRRRSAYDQYDAEKEDINQQRDAFKKSVEDRNQARMERGDWDIAGDPIYSKQWSMAKRDAQNRQEIAAEKQTFDDMLRAAMDNRDEMLRLIDRFAKAAKAIAEGEEAKKGIQRFDINSPQYHTSVASTLGELVGASIDPQLKILGEQNRHLAAIERNTKKLFRGII